MFDRVARADSVESGPPPQTWLPAKRLELKTSTCDGYRRNVERHILPTFGGIPIRRLRVAHLEDLHESKLRPTDGQRALSPKTVLEIHLVIRGALDEAVRLGILTRNVALIAKAPRLRQHEPTAWTAEQLRTFLRAAAGHRLLPALWTSAMTGMRRSELLGLRWDDLDVDAATISVSRVLIAVAYEICAESNLTTRPGVSRGKTRNARRRIDIAPPPSSCSPRGRRGNGPNRKRSASMNSAGCSPAPTARPSTRTRCHELRAGGTPRRCARHPVA